MVVLYESQSSINVLLEAHLGAFFIFVDSCCHNCGPLYAIVSSPQYTVFGN